MRCVFFDVSIRVLFGFTAQNLNVSENSKFEAVFFLRIKVSSDQYRNYQYSCASLWYCKSRIWYDGGFILNRSFLIKVASFQYMDLTIRISLTIVLSLWWESLCLKDYWYIKKGALCAEPCLDAICHAQLHLFICSGAAQPKTVPGKWLH